MKKIALMIVMMTFSYNYAQENRPMETQQYTHKSESSAGFHDHKTTTEEKENQNNKTILSNEKIISSEAEEQRSEIEYAFAVILLMILTRVFVYFKQNSDKQNNALL